MPQLRASLPVVFCLLVVTLPTVVALPTVSGSLHGAGTATTFFIHSPGGGATFEGGAFERTLVCSGCFVRVTFAQVNLHVFQNGALESLAPGTYEIRDYVGPIGITQVTGGYFLEFHGTAARVIRVPPPQ